MSNKVNENQVIPIICKEHGVFQMSIRAHLDGAGCPTCYIEGKLLTIKVDTYPTTFVFTAPTNFADDDKYYNERTDILRNYLNKHPEKIGTAPHSPNDFVVEEVEKIGVDKEVWYLGS